MKDTILKEGDPYWREQPYQIGPTLRQRYAMAAMQGLLGMRNWCEDERKYVPSYRTPFISPGGDDNAFIDSLADDAFAIADAMIAHEAKEREVQP